LRPEDEILNILLAFAPDLPGTGAWTNGKENKKKTFPDEGSAYF
jgi:hypothetical protein